MDKEQEASLREMSKRLERTKKRNIRGLARIEKMARYFPHKSLVDVIPEAQKGDACVDHFEVRDSTVHMLKAVFNDPMYYIPEGRYVRLKVNGGVMMTDTLFERATAYSFLKRARGDILITGLGIGMVLTHLESRRRVKSVTVIEKSQDVIDLVAPYVAFPKLEVVRADAFDWHPRDKRFDVIWHDIWPTISEDSLPEIEKLKRRYGQWMKRGGWQGAWAHEKIKEILKKRDAEMKEAELVRRCV